ncbi:MAG: hypothetical protein INH41_08210 [Myxococcaceae bacterium]|nr:hypothetical protein [Myxococcaceae bacterium]
MSVHDNNHPGIERLIPDPSDAEGTSFVLGLRDSMTSHMEQPLVVKLLMPPDPFNPPARQSVGEQQNDGFTLARGLDPTIVPGSNKENAFPSIALPESLVPARAGLTYVRNGTLGNAERSTSLPFICSDEGASEVRATASQASFNIEFSSGLNAAACDPSNRLGACLSLDFKIFAATWLFGSASREANVFRGQRASQDQQALLGETQNLG